MISMDAVIEEGVCHMQITTVDHVGGLYSGFQLFQRVGNPMFASYLGHLPTCLLFPVDFLKKQTYLPPTKKFIFSMILREIYPKY